MRTAQWVQLGDSEARIRRVIRHRETNMQPRIETGYADYMHEPIPLWHPLNPTALGLDGSWTDEVRRNIYRMRVPGVPDESDRTHGLAPYQITNKEIELPGLSSRLSVALERFLHQSLRKPRQED